MISFVVPGPPVPKGRPRTGKGRIYTDPKTRAAEEAIALLARSATRTPLEGAVSLSLTFVLERPPSTKRADPTVRPDVDNYAKTVMDACNGIVWADDAQVVTLSAAKRYGDRAMTIVTATPLVEASTSSTGPLPTLDD